MRVLRVSSSPWVAVLAALVAGWGCASNGPEAQLRDGERAYREGRQGDAELIWLESLSEAEA